MIQEITVNYVRVSSLKDSQKDSPEHQRMVCEEKALKEGLEIAHTYEDRSSGTSINGRDDIKKMVEDAKQGLFNTVIFASINRFARDQLDSMTLKRTLVDALGIRLISIEENYDSNVDKDEMKFTMFSMIAQQQSESISLASRRGKRMSATNRNFTGSKAPFGYDKTLVNNLNPDYKRKMEEKGVVYGHKNTLRPNDNEEVIKKIFHLYVNESMGEKSITQFLNEEGIPSPMNGIWGVSSIQRILQNEAYTGRNVFNKYEVKKVYDDINNMSDRKKRQIQKDKENWRRNEEKNWEAIIDDELFLEAQRLREIRGGGKRGGPKQKVNVFAGFIYCSCCGGSMVSMKCKNGKNINDGREYRYLLCSRRRRLGIKGCSNAEYIPYYEFRDAVIEEVSSILKKKINIEEKAKNIKAPSRKAVNNEKEKNRLEKSVDENRRLLFQLRKEKMLGNVDENQYQFEKEMYESEIKASEKKLKSLVLKIGHQENQASYHLEIKNALEELQNLTYDSFDEMHITLKKLIDKLVILPDRQVEIHTVLDGD